MYDTTNLTNAKNIYEITVAINELSNYTIGLFILVTIFFISFIVLKSNEQDTVHTLLVSSTICSVLAVMMWGINLLNWQFMMFPIIAMIASAVILKLQN